MTTFTVTGTITQQGPRFTAAAVDAGVPGPRGEAGSDGFVRPTATAGTETVEVTEAERTAEGLDFWFDGNMSFGWNAGFGAIIATAPNGPNNSAWLVGSGGELLDTVVYADQATTNIIDLATNYAAVGGTYVLPSGLAIGVYHGEEAVNDPPYTFWSFLGLASYPAPGYLPTDLGRIILPAVSKDDPSNTLNVEVAGGSFAVRDGWFYVFYRENLPDNVRPNLSVARCELDLLDTAAQAGTVPAFLKWDGEDWVELGLGGTGADILDDSMPEGATQKWTDVVWLEDSGVWMMGYSYEANADWGLGCRFSSDLINWSPHLELVALNPDAETIYVTLTAPLTEQSVAFDQRSIPGDEVWLFYTSSVNAATPGGDRWADATVNKRVITVRSPNGIFDEIDAVGQSPEAWTEVAGLSDDWLAVANGTARYYRHMGRGYLHLPVVSGGDSLSTVLTLPQGYRPDSPEVFPVWGTSDSTAFSPASVSVLASGAVTIFFSEPTDTVCLGGLVSWRIP